MRYLDILRLYLLLCVLHIFNSLYVKFYLKILITGGDKVKWLCTPLYTIPENVIYNSAISVGLKNKFVL